MENKIFKPTVAGKKFLVKDGDNTLFFIDPHESLPDHFRVYGWSSENETNFGYLKTTVWQQIDKGQWIIQ